MDKTSLVLKLNECFEKEDGCAIIHFIDGSDLLVSKKPDFYNLVMNVGLKYIYDDEEIVEECVIPYSSIVYVTLTTTNNLNRISKSYYKNNVDSSSN